MNTAARVASTRADLYRALAGNCSAELRHTLLDTFEQAVRADERTRTTVTASTPAPGTPDP